MSDSTTETPTPASLPELPPITSWPDNAAAAVAAAEWIRDTVKEYASELFAAPIEVPIGWRRTIATLLDLCSRRAQPAITPAMLRESLWRVERVISRRVSAAPKLRRELPDRWKTCDDLGRGTDEEFEAAVEAARPVGVQLAFVVAALEGRAAPGEPEPDPIPELPTTLASTMLDASDRLVTLTEVFQNEDAGSVNELDPATAADAARSLWTACVPLLELHNRLKIRGQQ